MQTIMIGLFLLFCFALAFIATTFYWVIFQRLSHLGIQSPRYELRPVQDLPAALHPLFDAPQQLLIDQGFEPVGPLAVQPLIYCGADFDWELLLFHPEWNTYAHIALHLPLEPTSWYRVAFYSFFGDRSLLLTLNGSAHTLMGSMPNTIVQDGYTADLEHQWELHCQALEQASEPAVKVPRPVYTDVLEAHYQDYLESLWDSEVILPAPLRTKQLRTKQLRTEQLRAGQPSLQRLSRWAAAKMAWQVCQHQGKTRALSRAYAARAQQDPTWRIEVPIALEAESFERMQRLEAGTVQPGGSRGLFWLSLGLCALSFHAYVSGPALVMLLGAIAFHEAGHYWAMRRLGYQDTSIFFLPFLGAATLGHKADASLPDQVKVLLAGPLPGLILGLFLLFLTGTVSLGPIEDELLRQQAAILIGLNLFNLLPIYPLDGGRIAHLILFLGAPWADILFKLSAVAALVLLGFISPVLWILAVAVAFGIPNHIRTARLQGRLRRSSVKGTSRTGKQQTTPRQIFQLLREAGYGGFSFDERYLIAKELWERRQEAPMSWRSRLIFAALYLVCLMGSPLGAFYAYRQTIVATAVPGETHAVLQVSEKKISEEKISEEDREAEKNREKVRLNRYVPWPDSSQTQLASDSLSLPL